MSAVAAGLVVALGIKLAMPLIKKRDFAGFACTLAAIAAVGILRVPLLPALAVLMPIGIAVQVLRVWRQS
jgi:chromate transporter